MKHTQKEKYILIQSESNSLTSFFEEFKKNYEKFKNEHLILDLLEVTINGFEDLSLFYELSKAHKSRDYSFVIVTKSVEIDQLPDDFVVVPTLHEAEDTIDIEAIERDIRLS